MDPIDHGERCHTMSTVEPQVRGCRTDRIPPIPARSSCAIMRPWPNLKDGHDHAIRTSSQSWLPTSPRAPSKIGRNTTATRGRTRTRLRLVGLGGNAVVLRDEKRSPQNSAMTLPDEPRLLGGARMDTIKSNEVIEQMLISGNATLEGLFRADILFIKSPMMPPIDDAVKDEVEEIKKLRRRSNNRLVVLVETTGGYVETVERIVNVFRQHYKFVEFVIPNYAYSAGTVLVMSGDEIHMDYYSILGPIDPQMPLDGNLMPGMGYLAKFQELLGKINAASDPATTRGELSYLINKFDPAMLFTIEQSIEHSKSLLREWLPKYKFKSWKTKETSKSKVTKQDRETRADQIATVLGDAGRWHSHGRGVSIKELESEEIKLKVNNYGKDQNLYENISHYYGLTTDYMQKRRMASALHSMRGLRRLG